jgi:hypothetical protein
MGVMYRPARPLPEGYRHFQDIVREIAAATGWKETGFHFGYEPQPNEIECIASFHFSNRNMGYVFPVEALHLRKIEHDGQYESWTVFRSAPPWWEVDL